MSTPTQQPQTHTPVPVNWYQLVVQGGAFTLVCWILYHGITYTLPSITNAYAEQQERDRALFRQEIKESREDTVRHENQFNDRVTELVKIVSDNQRIIEGNQKLILDALNKKDKDKP